MSIVSSFIGFLIIVYSLGYIRHEENQNEYYLMVVLFIGSMMGLVFSGNLIFLYLFWEIIAICCWRLIGFYRLKEHVRKADKAFLVTFFGAVVMLLGFIQIYGQTGTFDLTAMRGTLIPGSGRPAHPVRPVLQVGHGAAPHLAARRRRRPDHGHGPAPRRGAGQDRRLRLRPALPLRLPPARRLAATALPIIVVVSSLVAAGAATVETDFKRILAYSTVSQIGYIFLGFTVANAAGITGSLLFILMHGLAKAGLFLCAGIVIHATHKRDIREMGGLIKTMPITAVAFLLCAFSVIGIPPFGGFFSKFLVIMGTVQAGQVPVAAVALFTAVLTMFYLLRVFTQVFLGEAKAPGPREDAIHGLRRRRSWPSSRCVCRPARLLPGEAGRRPRPPTSAGGSDDTQHASLDHPPAGRWPPSCWPSSPRGVKLVRERPGPGRRRPSSLYLAFALFAVKDLELAPRPGWATGIDFELRLFHFSALHPARPGRVPLPDRPLLDGQDEGPPPRPGLLRPTSSCRPPWPTGRSWPTTSSPWSSSGKACWSPSTA